MSNISLAPLNTQYTTARDQSKREKTERTELIISDGLCPQISQLLEEALHEHIPLGRCKDPLKNIATALEERRSRGGSIETLHIVAHGKPGRISIGGIIIEKKDIKKYAATVKEWRVNEIALWCCESAVDENFIKELFLHSKAKRVWGSTQKLGNRKQPDLHEFNQTGKIPRNSARREPKAFAKETWASFDHALALSTEDISVNKAAGYAVFSITGGDSNGYINLQLKDGTATGNGADYGTSSGSQLEVSTNGGSTWSQYGTNAQLNSSGEIKVRTAIANDSDSSDEDFRLFITPIKSSVASLATYNVNYNIINLSGLALQSGTAATQGAVYKKTGAITIDGQSIDAEITIESIGNVSSFTFDNDGSNAARFQPEINSSSGESHVDFTFKFYKQGTNEQVAIKNFYINPADIDGSSSARREYVEISNLSSYQTDSSSQLSVSTTTRGGDQFTRFLGRDSSLSGISFENTASVIAEFESPVSELKLRMGVTDTNSSRRLFTSAIGNNEITFTNPVTTNTGTTISSTATIKVNNSDDNNPSVADVTVTFAESTAAGTSLANLNDTSGGDTDADGSALTYSITAGNDNNLFAINSATGEITLASGKSLDYETATSHTLTVSATEADGAGTDTATVTINVTNVDDNDPSVADITVTFAENTAAGTSLANLNDTSGDDTDADGSALTYSITAGNDNNLFAINSATGEITLASGKSLDYETATSHTLTVSATEADGAGTDTATVTINVTNVDDNDPSISDITVTFAENTAAGTSLANLNDTSGDDTDADGSALTYSITAGNDNNLFAINSATGEITLASGKSLDYETATSHTLTVSATEADGAGTDTATVTINVTNIDDNDPSVADITVTFAENTAAGTSLANLNDTSGDDTDADGSALTYSITAGNDNNLFAINSATGEITLASGKSLDYETATSHTLTVSAKEADGAGTDTATVTINVTNIDDNDPSVADITVTFAENTPAGTSLANLNDTSGDDTDADGSALTYSITAGNDNNLFAINSATGEITLASGKSLDYETATSHTLTVSATEADGAGTDTATVTINVTNIDDNDPSVADITVTFAENTAAGTSLANLNDTSGGDTDADGSALTYSITAGNDNNLFAINSATGEITLASGKSLDYETATSHTLTVSAKETDGAGTDTATVTINVTNIDDNDPSISDITVTFAENTAAGTSLANLNDTSGDDTDADGSALTYSITAGNDNSLFAINSATGEITLASGKSLDYETATSHTLTVSAKETDGAGTDTATVTINVTNIDDNDPSVADITVTFAENTAAGTSLANLNDTSGGDTDADGSALTYSITAGNDNNLFAINSATGEITLASGKSLDYETATSHTLTVSATEADGAGTDTATVTINVTNIDDNDPSISDITVTFAENTAAGTSLANLNDTSGDDTDADGSALTYSITAGNDNSLFAINSATGEITLASGKSLDYETATSHTLTVSAKETDGAGTDTATVTINVTNIDDNDPSISDITVTFAENTAAGTSLANLNDTSGDDTDADGSALTYSITAGNDNSLFAINSATGEITLASGKSLDYETATSHTLTVSAKETDGAGTDTATVTINVTNIDDTPPLITGPSGIEGAKSSSQTIPENTTGVYTFTANEKVNWLISGGEDFDKFSIDSNTGTLTFKSAPDYEAPNDLGDTANSNTYVVIVTAVDAAGNTADQFLTVSIADIDDTPPSIIGPSGSAGDEESAKEIDENTTTVHTFKSNKTITWSLSGGADQNKFTINSSTGELSFISAPDYENPNDLGDTAGNNTYVVNIRATDTTGKTADQTVTVSVRDINEKITAGLIDITDETDTGSDDTLTSNGNPIVTFTGSPGLVIRLKGPDGNPLPGSSYSVQSDTEGGVTTYTVILLDADPTRSGNQPFGDFINGKPTNNSSNSGDGAYTIQATTIAGNSSDIGSFEIATNPGSNSSKVLTSIDITDATDTGADDTLTSNGNPVITFTGSPELNIRLKGPGGEPLPTSSYSVKSSTADGVTTYTVTLRDADPTRPGKQAFGDFFDGAPTNNAINTGDGTYSIESSDETGQISEVGSFAIETNSLQPGEDFDNDGADDSFEVGKDSNRDGIDDSAQDSVATYLSSNGESINVLELVNPINDLSKDNKNKWGINNATKLILEGIAAPKETLAEPGETITELQELIKADDVDFESLGLSPDEDVVIATSDQPAFKLIPEIFKQGDVPKQQEERFIQKTNEEFQERIHQVEALLGEENEWNAVFKPDANGKNRFIDFDPVTGLGAILSDNDKNGRPDGVTIFLRDNAEGDLNPDPFIIDDPLGLSELAAAPKLVVDSSSEIDGSAALRVEGINGTGLWLKLKAIQTNAILQNSLELTNEEGESLGSIGGTARSKDLGKKLVYVPAGEALRFKQATGGQKDIHSPLIKIKEQEDGKALITLDDNGSDSDYDDLIISVKSRTFLTSDELEIIKTTRHQSTSSRGIIDLSQIDSDNLKIKLKSKTAAKQTNQLGLVKLDPNTNQKKYSINGVKQNDDNFLEAIRANLIRLKGKSFKTLRNSKRKYVVEWTVPKEEAGLYAPVLITESNNLLTFGDTTAADQLQHVKVLGDNHFGFEDELAVDNPDWDYNDYRVKFSIL